MRSFAGEKRDKSKSSPTLPLPSPGEGSEKVAEVASEQRDLKDKPDSMAGTGAMGIELDEVPYRSNKMGMLLGLSPGSVRRERNLVTVQKGDDLTQQAELYLSTCLRPEKPADLTLDRVLGHDGHLKMFRLFAEKSLCHEPVVLWTRCREFKSAPEGVAGAIALNILNNCLVADAPMLLSGLPSAIVERTKTAILEHDPSPFDDVLRIARTAMAALFPQYAAFLDSVYRQMPVPGLNLSPRRGSDAGARWEDSESLSPFDSPDAAPTTAPRQALQSMTMTLQELITPRSPLEELGKTGTSTRFLLSRRESKPGNILGMTPKALQMEEMTARQQRSSRLREEMANYRNLLPSAQSNPSGRITASDVPLEMILANPSHRKTFLLFAEACYSQGAVLFYLRVNEFRAMTDQPHQVLQATALNIWKNFLSSKAAHQIIISSAALSRTREMLLSNQISVSLYDECQREAYSVMAFSIYPQYLVFLNNSTSPRKPLKPSPRKELDKLLEEEVVLRQRLKLEMQLNVDDEDSSESSISFSGIRRSFHPSTGVDEVEEESESTTTLGTTDSPVVTPHKTTVTRSVRAVSSVVGTEVGAGLRARQAPETKKLFFNGIDMSTLSFADMMADAAQRESFRVYCESIHKLEYLTFLERVAAFKAGTAPGFPIWTEFLSNHSPTPVITEEGAEILDRVKAAFGEGQTNATLFDEAERQVLTFLEAKMFPDYLRFMRRVNDKNIKTAELRRSMSSAGLELKRSSSTVSLTSPGRAATEAVPVANVADNDKDKSTPAATTVIPSLRDCLVVDSPAFVQFFDFATKAHCVELLAFWKAVSVFEGLTSKDKAHQVAEEIYDTYISSVLESEINISSKHQKEITFDIQNGLIRSDMFENAKREVQQILAQGLFPNFVLWLSQRATEHAVLEAAAPRVLLPRPEIQELLAWLRRGCSEASARTSGTLSTFASKVLTPTEENFANHAFFNLSGSSLRLIVCSAFASHQKGFRVDFPADAVAELRLLHLERGKFAAEVFNAKKKKLAELEQHNTTDDEILGLIAVFTKLHAGDFVASFSEEPHQASII